MHVVACQAVARRPDHLRHACCTSSSCALNYDSLTFSTRHVSSWNSLASGFGDPRAPETDLCMTRRPPLPAIGLECKVGPRASMLRLSSSVRACHSRRRLALLQAHWCQRLITGQKAIELRAYALPEEVIGARPPCLCTHPNAQSYSRCTHAPYRMLMTNAEELHDRAVGQQGAACGCLRLATQKAFLPSATSLRPEHL